VNRAAFESLIIEEYRTGRLGIREVAECLGLQNRFDAERWFGACGVTWNYVAEDLEEDRRTEARLDPGSDR
jgi:hypothetical protein